MVIFPGKSTSELSIKRGVKISGRQTSMKEEIPGFPYRNYSAFVSFFSKMDLMDSIVNVISETQFLDNGWSDVNETPQFG